MAKQRVLVDTCVIIEAIRINCWKALCQHLCVETVQCCVDECCNGDPLTPGRVPIVRDELVGSLTKVHVVSDLMLASLKLENDNLPALDDGELHMMAWLHSNPSEAILTMVSTADRAAVRAAHVLKLLDRVISLQELAQSAHIGAKQLVKLERHYTQDWLSTLRMQLKMNIL